MSDAAALASALTAGRNRAFGLSRRMRLGILLGCGTALYFLANIQRVAVPGAIFDQLQSEIGVGAAGVTALGSAFMYVYALAQLLVGLLVDRYGGARVIAVGGLLFALGSLLCPCCHGLWPLLLCRVLVGLGASTIYLGMVRELLRSFPSSFAIALAGMIMVGYTGGIVANAPFSACAELVGWRTVLTVFALLSLLAQLGFLAMQTTLVMPPPRRQAWSARPFLRALGQGGNRRIIAFCALHFGSYYVLQTVIGKKFLEDFCRMEPAGAALVLTLMGLLCAVSGLGMAFACRCCGGRTDVILRAAGLVGCGSLLAICVAVALQMRGPWMALPLCLLAAVASSAAVAIPLLHANNRVDTGAVVSLFNGACFLSVALLGNLVGLLLGLDAPVIIDGRAVFSDRAYLLVFTALGVCSAVALTRAFGIRDAPAREAGERAVSALTC